MTSKKKSIDQILDRFPIMLDQYVGLGVLAPPQVDCAEQFLVRSSTISPSDAAPIAASDSTVPRNRPW